MDGVNIAAIDHDEKPVVSLTPFSPTTHRRGSDFPRFT